MKQLMQHRSQVHSTVIAAILGFAAGLPAQETPDTGTPVFRVEVVSRSIKVVNFHHRQGSTELTLVPSGWAPKAKGEVKVDSRQGATRIDARIEKLNRPQNAGAEYLTYVLWAITPEGRPENLGEVTIDGDGNARLQAATELQSFGMIVTAEPYYAVTQPSDLIVMEATVSKGTTGTISPLEAKYDLWPKGMYEKRLAAAPAVRPSPSGKDAPSALIQAKHAVAIARSMGAGKYAADTLARADLEIRNADGYFNNKGDLKKIQTLARNATQLAEDARLIAVRRAEEERLEAERIAAENRLAAAKTAAEQEARRRELADSERRIAEENQRQAQLRAERERRERERVEAEKAAELAAARARAEQQRIESEQQIARQRQEQERLLAEKARIEAEVAKARSEQESARAEAQRAEQARLEAEAERAKMREQLRIQLNMVLATRETARGLIVNISDVLFQTGQYALQPGAREKLAKISGILLAHPGLTLEVEGHTDSVGGDLLNQTLSERRAESVRAYLIAQGVKPEAITARGYGKSQPVADNMTAAGRQQNRRVELVVSGQPIQGPAASAAVREPAAYAK